MQGKAKIQLFDADTGRQVYEAEEKNLVTDAIKNIMSVPPAYMMMGLPTTQFYGGLSPVATALYGGIMLYGQTLTESKSNVMPDMVNPPPLVGHAGGNYSGTNVLRGNYNENESGQIEGGWRHVWDFATDKANGTIRCLALTSKHGGNSGFVKNDTDFNDFLEPYLMNQIVSGAPSWSGYYWKTVSKYANGRYEILLGIFEDGKILTQSAESTNASPAYRIFINQYSIVNTSKLGLQTEARPEYLELVKSVEAGYTNDSRVGCTVSNDGKIVFVRYTGSSTKTIEYKRFSPITLELEDSKTMSIENLIENNLVSKYISESGVEFEDKLYFYYNYKVYSIDKRGNSGPILELTKNVSEPFSWGFLQDCAFGYGQILDLGAQKTYIPVLDGRLNRPINIKGINPPLFIFQYSDAGKVLPAIYTKYHGTINNLSAPITKTSNQTMKIVYELLW